MFTLASVQELRKAHVKHIFEGKLGVLCEMSIFIATR